jgi:hypothetical protein
VLSVEIVAVAGNVAVVEIVIVVGENGGRDEDGGSGKTMAEPAD